MERWRAHGGQAMSDTEWDKGFARGAAMADIAWCEALGMRRGEESIADCIDRIKAEALREAANAEQAVVAELRSQKGWGRTERCAAIGAVMGCIDRLRARADELDPGDPKGTP
jgi:hypothetical protein